MAIIFIKEMKSAFLLGLFLFNCELLKGVQNVISST